MIVVVFLVKQKKSKKSLKPGETSPLYIVSHYVFDTCNNVYTWTQILGSLFVVFYSLSALVHRNTHTHTHLHAHRERKMGR